MAPFVRARAGGEMGCRDKPGNDSEPRVQTPLRPLQSLPHGYPAAAATARFSITPIRWARYSAEACMSLLRPSEETATLTTASGVKLPPSAASASPRRNTHGPAPVTATRTPATG